MSNGQTISPELRQWMVAQLAAGHSIPALRISMREAGWYEDVADAALSELGPLAPIGVAAAPEPPREMPGPDLTDSPLEVEADGRKITILQTMQNPRVVVFGNLLTDEECEGLIAAARVRLARSLTVETKTGGEVLNVDRTSDGMFFERGENEIVTSLESRLAALLRWPIEFGEGLQILRYSPGAQYRPHYDYFDPGEPGTPTILKRGGQRVGTLVMYLNTPKKGGATTFPDVGLEVAPIKGNAVFFSYDRPHVSTRSLHGGAPVIAGEKWVATKWLREREFI